MTPIELRITRFRSFKEETVFRFPEGPGLFFLWGENQAEPRLEANGSGKSSLWEALTWCLYGKTSRGLKAGDAANWDDGKGCKVEFVYEIEEPWMQYTVTRTWGPISWTLDNGMGDRWDLAKDEGNELAAHLKLDYGAFLQCALMAQAQPMFLDLKAEAKAQLFSEVMGLDRWLELSKRASKKAGDQDLISRRLEREIAALEGELRSLSTTDLETKAATWRKDLDKELAELADRYDTDLEKLSRAEAYLKECQGVEADARARFAAAKAQPAARCKTCDQIIPSEATRTVEKLAKALEACTRDVSDARRSKELLCQSLDEMEGRSVRLEREKNPYEDLIRGIDERVARAEDDIYDLRQELDASLESYALKQSWIRWFKEIRLSEIAHALNELEIEVNSQVNDAGLIDWELRFAVDQETKSGSISRGFSVTVISPHNPKPVPWEAWSGGEGQRLRLAAQQGLANLIRSRSGTSLDLEVWDEPTQWMSHQGVVDLLDSLKARAREERRQIWIVDHRSLGYGGFDGSIGAVKTKNGTHFEQTTPYISPDPKKG